MSYSVYAKLPDGRTIKYGKKLNSVTEVNDAMNEMKRDLKDAGITAKVGYKNDNPPAPSRSTVKKSQPKAAPKTSAKKTSKPDPLDRNLKEEISKSKSRAARLIADAIRPDVTIRQVVNSINKDGDTFKLVTGESIQITRTGRSVQWSRKDEYIVDAVCVAVARALGRRQYDVKSVWNYLGEYGNRANFGQKSTAQLTKKDKTKVAADVKGKVKVGDIFVGRFGVTGFPQYYEVLAVKGTQTVTVAETKKTRDVTYIRDPGFNQDYDYESKPIRGKYDGRPHDARVQIKNGEIYIRQEGHRCELWDGVPIKSYSYMD